MTRKPIALSHGVKDEATSKAIRQLEGVSRDLVTATAQFTSGNGGTVPASTGSTADFLRADSTWASPKGEYLGRLVITASGSGSLDSRCGRVVIRAVAGGGGGGGAGSTGTSYGVGGGGASGVYLEASVTVSSLNYTATIGAAGAAGSNSGTSGGAGGDTTLTLGGVTYTAKGGGGGNGTSNVTLADVPGGTPGAGSSGGDWYAGFIGGRGFATNSGTFPGDGASSPFGTGGAGGHGGYSAGGNATGYGAGGGGGNGGPSNTHPGGTGSPGLIVIEQFT